MTRVKPAFPRLNRAHPQLDKLLLWLPFYEGSGDAHDLSGYRRHGVFDSGLTPITWVAGRHGWALSFPDLRDSHIECPNLDLPANPALTVSLWFRTASNDGAGDNAMLSWGSSSYGGAAYRLLVEDGTIWIRVNSGATSWGSGYNDNRWHHVVLTNPANATLNDMRCFVDGVDLGLGSNSQNVNPDSSTVRIGNSEQPNSIDWAYDGQLDDVRIASRQYAATEVRGLYLDPWAPFRRSRTAVFFVPTGGGGAVSVTPANIESTANVTQSSLTVDYATSPEPIESASNVTQPSVTRNRTVSPQSIESVANVTSPTVVANTSVQTQSIECASNVTSPSVSASGSITATPQSIEAATNVSTPPLSVAYQLAAQSIESASNVTQPTVARNRTVTPTSIESAATVSSPDITVAGAITATPASIECAANISQPALAVSYVLGATNIESASNVTSPTVTIPGESTGNFQLLQLSDGGIAIVSLGA